MFATTDDLSTRLNRKFTTDEAKWLDELLADATAYLRREIGQIVAPRQTATFSDWPSAGLVDLPQWPVVSVDSVERDGEPIQFEERLGSVRVQGDQKVDVTFTFGRAEVPRDLTAIVCALVSQQLSLVESNLGLSVGGLSSVQLDDFKIAFADGGEKTGLYLPKVTLDSLRERYGRGGIVQVEVRA